VLTSVACVLITPKICIFLGAFEKFQKATVCFNMSVRLSSSSKSAPVGRISVKFGIGGLLLKAVETNYR
jgi:hypothetical protein